MSAPQTAPARPSSIDTTAASFQKDVLEASRHQVVLVDFWADWCGPCKSLTPALERVVAASNGAARLVKVNVDKEKMLAAQFQVQSLPTVYAFIDGRPADGFMGALPESQLKQFLDRLLKLKPGAHDIAESADIAAALDDADAHAAQGAWQDAHEIYTAVVQIDPKNARAYAGLVRFKLSMNDMPGAALLLEQMPEALAKDPTLVQLKTSLSLATEFTLRADRAALEAAVATTPKNHEGLYALAGDAIARGEMEAAAGYLLNSIKHDRHFNEGQARQLLLRLFEAVGLESEFTMKHRRALSAVLFS